MQFFLESNLPRNLEHSREVLLLCPHRAETAPAGCRPEACRTGTWIGVRSSEQNGVESVEGVETQQDRKSVV